MKKSIFALAAAITALVACNKNDVEPMTPQHQQPLEACELTVGISGGIELLKQLFIRFKLTAQG